ncbi:MAG: V-type ATP synthase subunit E [Sphaerochaetaceae bacterium]|nr:V-type ATP synthase subunit E [Sphaerochaetaceae bacterium]
MELQIQDLVSSIKKEGIDAAKKKSAEIIAEAEEKAAGIVAQAQSEASELFEKTKKEIELLSNSAQVGAQQARRDAVLSFKKEVETHYKNILSASVAENLNGDALASLIKAVVTDKDVSSMKVEIASVTDQLKSALAEEIKNGLEIVPVKGVNAGFRLASKDGSGFFDCTDEAIAEMLAPFFSDLSI